MSDHGRDPGREPTDADLRERFARLRMELADRMPGFAAIGQRPRPPQGVRFPFPLLAGAGAAAALAAFLLLRPSTPVAPPPARAVPPSLGEWRAPTDFLLQTPGRDLLSRLPTLGQDLPRLEPPSPAPERSMPS
jgi:hypothetical protein